MIQAFPEQLHVPQPSEGIMEKDQNKTPTSPHRRASIFADALDSPGQEHQRIEDAESLFNISQPPDEATMEKSQNKLPTSPHRRASVLADALESPEQEQQRFQDAESLFSISQPPDEAEVEEGAASTPTKEHEPKVYKPMAFAVITSLIPGSIFGVLARLGLLAITNYQERSIFPLAWVQATGCLIMGFALGLRDQIGA